MDQPGVEVRPIEMITGDSEFNEVFFSDARCPKENVIGGVNNGWAVAMTLLGYERGEAAATFPVMFRIEYDRLEQLARDRGTEHRSASSASGWPRRTPPSRSCGTTVCAPSPATSTAARPVPRPGCSSCCGPSTTSGPPSSPLDLFGVDATVPSGRAPASSFQTDDPGAPNDSASWVGTFFNARAGTIYAGSSEIQRNIVGEMVLGSAQGAQAGHRRSDVERATGRLGLPPGALAAARAVAAVPVCGGRRSARPRRWCPAGWWRRTPFLPRARPCVDGLPAHHGLRRPIRTGRGRRPASRGWRGPTR